MQINLMKKIYFLGTCNTCQRIMNEWRVDSSFELQDIKVEKITPTQLDELKELTGSYETLFSRVARKYREMKLGEKSLSENDYRELILSEYTFLKRPVLILDNQIFIGNSKVTVNAALNALTK